MSKALDDRMSQKRPGQDGIWSLGYSRKQQQKANNDLPFRSKESQEKLPCKDTVWERSDVDTGDMHISADALENVGHVPNGSGELNVLIGGPM